MAVLYGHILNPLRQVTLRIRHDSLDTGQWHSVGGRSGDGVDALYRKWKWMRSMCLTWCNVQEQVFPCPAEENKLFTSISRQVSFNNDDINNTSAYHMCATWKKKDNKIKAIVPLNKLLSTKSAEVPHCGTDDHWSKQLIDPGGC